MNTLEARRRILGRNVYKRTTEGNPAIAQGSLARMYPGITMKGWTEQAQYEGKNLFDIESAKNPENYVEGAYDYWGLEIPAQVGKTYTFNRNLANGYGLGLGSAGLKQDNNETVKYWLVGDTNESLNNSAISIMATQDKVYFVTNQRDPELLKQLIETCFESPMLNEGTTALPYEPYTGNQPSPSPEYPQEIVNSGKYNLETGKYEVEVRLTGKNTVNLKMENVTNSINANIADIENGVKFSLSQSLDSYVKLNYLLTGGKKYYISYDVNRETDNVNSAYCPISIATKNGKWFNGDVYKQEWGVSDTSTTHKHFYSSFAVPEDNDVSIYIVGNALTSASGTSEIYNLCISEIDGDSFEPYKQQTVTVTSDRPLTKWDKLEKRNGQWGWVYKSAEIVLDGTENYTSGSENYVSDFSSNCYTNISNMVRDGRTNAFMNRLSNIDYSWAQPDAIGFSKNFNQLHVRISNSDLGTTGESSASEITDAMKAYMAQQYEEGNPFIALYETAEETFVPLAESEQEAMNALYTFRPTTVLSNDCECNMSLMYKTKKSMQSAPGGGIRKPIEVTSYFVLG